MDDDDADEPGGPVLQPRCVHCLRDHYVPAMGAVSAGRAGCVWCGRRAPVFATWRGYLRALWGDEEVRT